MTWTCTGQYMIVCIGENSKKSRNKNSEIKIWSSYQKKVIQCIEGSEFLMQNIFTLIAHPFYETIFVTGDAG